MMKGAYFVIDLKEDKDRIRHFCSSAREIINKLFNMLAPDNKVLQSLEGSKNKIELKKRLQYIANKINCKSYSKFNEDDIESVIEIKKILNKGVHEFLKLTEPELEDLKQKIKKLVKNILSWMEILNKN